MKLRDFFQAITRTLTSRVLAVLGGVVLSFIVANQLGASALGSFTVYLSLLGVLGILARRGQDTLLIREVAHTVGPAEDSLRLLIRTAKRIALTVAVFSVVGSVALGSALLGDSLTETSLLFLLSLPAFCYLSLMSSFATGLGLAWLAPIFEIGGVSLCTSIILITCAIFISNVDFQTLLLIFNLVMVLILLVGSFMMSRLLDRGSGERSRHYRERDWDSKSEVRFTIIGLAGYLVSSGSFLIAAPFLSDQSLGLVRLAERIALMVSFPLFVVNPILSPIIARLHKEKNKKLLLNVMKTALLTLTFTSPSILALIATLQDEILSVLAPSMTSATEYLGVLLVTNFLVALMGPFIVMVHMTGGERPSMYCNMSAAAVALCLIPVLSARFGALGFVVSYSIAILVRSISISLVARYKSTDAASS